MKEKKQKDYLHMTPQEKEVQDKITNDKYVKIFTDSGCFSNWFILHLNFKAQLGYCYKQGQESMKLKNRIKMFIKNIMNKEIKR